MVVVFAVLSFSLHWSKYAEMISELTIKLNSQISGAHAINLLVVSPGNCLQANDDKEK